MDTNYNLKIGSCSFSKQFPVEITKEKQKQLVRCDSYILNFTLQTEKRHSTTDFSFSILVDDEIYSDPLTQKTIIDKQLAVNEPIEVILNLLVFPNTSYKKKITIMINKNEISKSIYLQLTEPKMAIIPFFRESSILTDIHKKQQYISDGLLSEDIILKEKVPKPGDYWHRRIVTFNDKKQSIDRTFIPSQWITSYFFGYPAKSVFCQLVTQGLTATEKIILKLHVLHNEKIVFNCKKNISSQDKDKVPILQPKTPFIFSEDGFIKDTKIKAQFTVSDIVNEKLESEIIFYNKSLIENHSIEFLEISLHPFWNTIREQTFKIINKQYLVKIIEKGLKKPTYRELLKNNSDRFEEFGKMKTRELCNYIITKETFLEKVKNLSNQIVTHFMSSLKEQIVHYTTKEGIILLRQRENLKLKNTIIHDFSQLFAAELTSNKKTRKEISNIVNNFLDFLITF